MNDKKLKLIYDILCDCNKEDIIDIITMEIRFLNKVYSEDCKKVLKKVKIELELLGIM